jgi:hypothetical protein
MLKDIVDRLYAPRPQRLLFHYTSQPSLLSIATSGVLWASELHHANDAEELRQFAGALTAEIGRRRDLDELELRILVQFNNWLVPRVADGPLIFATSFSEHGNLLSQWRGYCPPGQGVSLGFEPGALCSAAGNQGFLVGRCIYDSLGREQLAKEVVDAVLKAAIQEGPATKAHPTQSYHPVFTRMEPEILLLAALVKGGAFSEEAEWRVVSPVHSNYVVAPIKYRSGPTMLIPYLELSLPRGSGDRLAIAQVVLGPTPTSSLSMRSLGQFLARYVEHSSIVNGLIPYRG